MAAECFIEDLGVGMLDFGFSVATQRKHQAAEIATTYHGPI